MGLDSLLQAVLSQFKGRDYLVVYATTPREDIESNATPHGGAAYEPEFQEPLKMEIKRATGYIRGDNSTKIDRRPLFEKYQFFTPGKLYLLLHLTTTNKGRAFHGSPGDAPPSGHPVSRHQSHLELGSVVRCVREGDGTCCA